METEGALLDILRAARTAIVGLPPAGPREAVERRRLARGLEETICRLEGEEAPKELIAVVCHDLKDPLASIVMGAAFLKKALPPDAASTRRIVDAIARSADRASRMVDDLHDVAALEAGTLDLEVRACDLRATLAPAITELEVQARAGDVRFSVHVEGDPLLVRCEPARLLQILRSLVGNALRFTAAGGEVSVRVEIDGRTVRTSVRDTGRGIEPERLAAIFDRVANSLRSPRDGPGLGLALARGLVEAQGGAIGVESQVGQGSLFWFTLPSAV